MAVRAWATVSAEAKGSSQPPRQSGRKMSIRERRSMSLSFERMPQGGLSPRVGLFPAIRILDGLFLFESFSESKGLCCELFDWLQRLFFALLGVVFAFRRETGEIPVHIFR